MRKICSDNRAQLTITTPLFLSATLYVSPGAIFAIIAPHHP